MDLMNMLIASQYLQKNNGGSSGGSSGGDGESGSIAEKEVFFYDYDGTLLHSYTLEEAAALTELPALPTQKGLICQGWTHTLEEITGTDHMLDVGATYITDDGKTRLYITITVEGRMDIPLYFNQTVANGVTVDWGDGSVAQTAESAGDVNLTHTYTSIGEYVISLDVADGCLLALGKTEESGTGLLGTSHVEKRVYKNRLQKVEIGERVNDIGFYAFFGCRSLASITIPEGVTTFGVATFQDCRSLTSIVIPRGVTSIGSFAACFSLTSIVIPRGVTSVAVFTYCYSLKSVVIPEGLDITTVSF